MSGRPSSDGASGGLDHLIEKLRLSDNASLRSRTGAVENKSAHPPGHHYPAAQQQQLPVYPQTQHGGHVYPQNPANFQSGSSQALPHQRQHQQSGFGRSPQTFHQQRPSYPPGGLSLMDYVKSPGKKNATPQIYPASISQTSYPQQQQHQQRQPQHYQQRPHQQSNHQHPYASRGGSHHKQYERGFQAPRQHYDPLAQSQYLERLASEEIPKAAMEPDELHQKQEFRLHLLSICQKALTEEYPEYGAHLNLIPYGSMLSGFAVKGSDMDIICSISGPLPDLEPEIIPRLLEIALLKNGIGARALTRTRVPILKVCERPTAELHAALLEDHAKWKHEKDNPRTEEALEEETKSEGIARVVAKAEAEITSIPGRSSEHQANSQKTTDQAEAANGKEISLEKGDQNKKEWRREKTMGPLDFPKSGIGFQCDISFRGLLGVYNTQLLRCYSACDPRVRDMVLFVKSWAKQRKVNSSYSGTLCSYGWVILVLHFLINIARPPVLPNLQHAFGAAGKQHMVDGYNVAFADDELQLQQLALKDQITQNEESIGSLLANFFHYYAHQGARVIGGGFRWKDDVISIRNQGGIVSKASKGWTGASNTMVNNVEVRQRYLLAVECPIETDHNVARTVHHHGVVAIRDELRRAWSILECVGSGRSTGEELFDGVEVKRQEPSTKTGQQTAAFTS